MKNNEDKSLKMLFRGVLVLSAISLTMVALLFGAGYQHNSQIDKYYQQNNLKLQQRTKQNNSINNNNIDIK